MKKDVVVKALAFVLIFSSEAGAQMQARGAIDPKTPAIQVTGTGSVQTKPDIATISIGVSTEDASAEDAVSSNSAATAKVISELEAASIAKKDLRTSNFSVYPQHHAEGQEKRQTVTYRASNTVTVTIRNIEKVGEILTKAVGAGSNQITGPNFSVSDPEKYLSEARKKAVENAMAKAGVYASAAGLKLGAVLAMTEDGTSGGPIFTPRALNAAAPAVPIESGEKSLDAHIVMVIELKP